MTLKLTKEQMEAMHPWEVTNADAANLIFTAITLTQQLKDKEAELRPSVLRFAKKMEAQLKQNESRGGWEGLSLDYLLERLQSQIQDLPAYQSQGMHGLVDTTLADIANFAMMYSENVPSESDAATPTQGVR